MTKAKQLIERFRLNEMATVVSARGGKFKISIYPEPQGNPSFHVTTPDYEVVLRISDMEILEWKFGKKNKFTSDEKKFLKELLNQKSKDLNTPNWKFLIATWNANNEKYQIDMKKPSYL